MRKALGIILLSITVLLIAGCGASDAGNYTSTDNADRSYSQNVSDRNSIAQTDSQTTKENEKENAVDSTAENTSSGTTELLTAPEAAYCNINGSSVTDGYFVYTNDATYGESFSFTGLVDGGNRIIMIMVFVPTNNCASNVVLKNNDLTGDAFIYYLNTDGYTADEMLSLQDTASFANNEFILYDYSSHDSAIWSVKTDITTSDGTLLSFDMAGGSNFITQEELNNSSDTGDGICNYCHGSGSCHVCYGLGYWYSGGITTECSSCGGTGACYYCEGTGKQVYLIRGVPIY